MLIVSVAILRNSRGEIFIQERPEGKPLANLWEFPGGKCKLGEPPERALARELTEELAIRTDPRELVPFSFVSSAETPPEPELRPHTAQPPAPARQLLLLVYQCEQWQGEIAPQEGQRGLWVAPGSLPRYPMPPADAPVVAALAKDAPLRHIA